MKKHLPFSNYIKKISYIIFFLISSPVVFGQTITPPVKTVTVSPTSCGVIDVKLDIKGANPIDRPLEVVLVIDISGSMNSGTPLSALTHAKNAANDFIDKVFLPINNSTHKNKVAIVTFSSTAITSATTSKILTDETGIAALKSIVTNLTAGGNTNLQDGIVKADNELINRGTYDCTTARSIVVLTDGLANLTGPTGVACSGTPTCSQTAITAATAAKTHTTVDGVFTNQIFTVGLLGAVAVGDKSTVNSTLTAIQNSGYYSTDNPDYLGPIYNQIFAKLSWIAKNLTVTETIPNGFTISSITKNKGTVTPVGQVITWNVDFLNPETITLNYKLTPTPLGSDCGEQTVGTSSYSYDDSTCSPVSNISIYSPTVIVPCPTISLASQTDVLCFGGADGSITLNDATGSESPYTYDWSDIPGTNNTKDRTGLIAGTYSVIATDKNGCASTQFSVTIKEPASKPIVTLTGTISIAENAANVATLTANLSTATTEATVVTLGYTGTATSPADYLASSSTIIIPAGDLTGTVTIDPSVDVIFEGSETVIATITGISGGNCSTIGTPNQATVTITDEQSLPNVTLTGTTTIAENATDVATLTATLSTATTQATVVTLGYTGTATSPADYVASSSTITIPAGSLTATVTIDPSVDAIFEGSETVIATITGVSGGNGTTIGTPNQATVTITDEQSLPNVTLTGTTTIAENALGVATLTATLSIATTQATVVTLGYTGTATSPADYVASSSTITIPAGSLIATVTIDPSVDVIFEGSETVIATITGVSGGNGTTIGTPNQATVTITDEQSLPNVTLTGTTTIAENALGVATLTATLSIATTQATVVTLGYTGTATSPADYVASSSTITIPAGSLTATVTIDPSVDVIFEGSETVIATITGVSGGNGTTIGSPNQATVTITDEQNLPNVTLTGTTTIAENTAGVATLTATLSTATTVATVVTLGYTGTATSATDYVASSLTITIPAGFLTGTVTIDPSVDTIYEGSETVIATITGVSGGNGTTIGSPNQATVTITDEQNLPNVTLTGTTTIAENAAGVATLTATLSTATTVATVVTLGYTGTATSAADYVASSSTITIPAGSLTATVTIDPSVDAIFEGSETVIATITGVSGGNGTTIGTPNQATVTITDEQSLPNVTLTGTTTIAENALGVATLTATLSIATTQATVVTLGYTGTATSPADYVTSSSTITIPAGSLTATVTIDPSVDVIFEGSETVIATITGVSGGNGTTIGTPNQATVTITDEQSLPNVTLTGTTTIAENALGVATLTATLSIATTQATVVTLGYTGTATSPADYVTSSSTITIPAGSLTATVTIDPSVDVIFEGSETVIATITGVSGGNGTTIGTPNQATVTITDEQSLPNVTLTGTTTIAENATDVATLTATLSTATTQATVVTLGYTGTATSPADYVASSSTITIPAGSLTATVTIDPSVDAIFEGSETVIATITGVSGGNGTTIGTPNQATVTITDEQSLPNVTLTGTTTIAENATDVATLTATLSTATTQATVVTLGYTGTATSPADYVASSSTITIPAGSLTATVTIDPSVDAIFEGSETVIATITGVSGGNGTTIGTPNQATVTITDEQSLPNVTLTGTTTIAENALGVATLTATLSTATTVATVVTLGYTGTATSAADYVASSSTITIPAGSLTATVTIDPSVDAIFEGSETVIATITGVSGGNGTTIGTPNQATVTITDEQTLPNVTLTGTTTIAENAAGVATLTATLSTATTVATVVTLGYTGTATSAADYVASSSTITIPAGSLTATVTIDPSVDAIFEGSETVIATITGVSGGNGTTIGSPNQAIVTITDEQTLPNVILTGTTTIAENAAGVATLTATLSTATTVATVVTLGYTGTATSATDYVASDSIITISAGDLTGTVTIDPSVDTIYEGSETVIATITGVSGGNGTTIGSPNQAIVTITDEQNLPNVTLTGTTTIAENAAGVATLTATLSTATTVATVVTLEYTGTATSATDYVASDSIITIPAGDLTGTVTIDPSVDTIYEGSETVIATITGVSGGNGTTIGSPNQATVTITDQQSIPAILNISPASAIEGNPVVFEFTLTNPSTTATTFIFTLSNGTAESNDYTTTDVTIIVPAGSISATISVPTTDDAIDESDETFVIANGNVTAIGTILDNDDTPDLEVSKTANATFYSSVGEIIIYTILVKNTGNVTLHNIVVTDELTNWSTIIESLAPDSIQQFTQNYTVTQSDREKGSITNTVFAHTIAPNGTILTPEATVTIEAQIVLGCGTVIVHNAFSPNGDGINELFIIDNIDDLLCFPDNTVEIYNRWGVLVFETTGYDNVTKVFRGISEGRATISQSSGLPAGTYYYILSYTSITNTDQVQTNKKDGYLYLTR